MKKFALVLCSTTILTGCSGTQLASDSSDAKLRHALSSYGAMSSYETGKYQLRAGNFGLAIDAFKLALDRDPTSIPALNGLAIAYTRLGRDDVAKTYWDRALEINPHSKITNTNLAYLSLTRNETVAAEKYSERARSASTALTSSNVAATETVGSYPSKFVEVRDVMQPIQTRTDDTTTDVKQANIKKVGDKEWHLNTTGTPLIADAKPVAASSTPSPSVHIEPAKTAAAESSTAPKLEVPAPVKMAAKAPEEMVPQPVTTELVKAADAATPAAPQPIFIGSVDSATAATPVEPQTLAVVPAESAAPQTPDVEPAKTAALKPDAEPQATASAPIQTATVESSAVLQRVFIAPTTPAIVAPSTVAKTVTPMPVKTASVEILPKDDAFVRISNGTGRTTMAGRFSGFLSQHGVSTNLIANANSFSYRQTIIFYNPGKLNAAQQIASVMPVSVKLVEVKGGSGVVEVVLGSDLSEFDERIKSA